MATRTTARSPVRTGGRISVGAQGGGKRLNVAGGLVAFMDQQAALKRRQETERKQQALIGEQKRARDEANKANLDRLAEIRKGLGGERERVDRDFQRSRGQIASIGGAGRANISEVFSNLRGAASQRAISGGVFNSVGGALGSQHRAIGESQGRSLGALEERLAGLRSGVEERRSGALSDIDRREQGLLERVQDLGPDVNRAASLLERSADPADEIGALGTSPFNSQSVFPGAAGGAGPVVPPLGEEPPPRVAPQAATREPPADRRVLEGQQRRDAAQTRQRQEALQHNERRIMDQLSRADTPAAREALERRLTEIREMLSQMGGGG